MTTLRTRRMERGDVRFGQQRGAYATGGEAALQSVTFALRTLAGEWVFDPSVGTDYLTILQKGTSIAQAAAIIQARIVNTNGVKGLLDFLCDYDRNTRKFFVRTTVKTVDGFATWTGALP